MPSKMRVVELLLTESGKTSSNVRTKIEAMVGEITYEMLSQNEGRFEALSRTQSISVLTTATKYILNSDFYTSQNTFHEIDSSGDFVRELAIVSKAELFSRKSETAYSGPRMAYIEYLADGDDGPGWYLCLGDDASEATTYVFEYYREPTEDDTNLVKDTTLLKKGVRGSLPAIFPETSQNDLYYYLQKIDSHMEHRSFMVREKIVKPPKRTRKFNVNMHNIGGGK